MWIPPTRIEKSHKGAQRLFGAFRDGKPLAMAKYGKTDANSSDATRSGSGWGGPSLFLYIYYNNYARAHDIGTIQANIALFKPYLPLKSVLLVLRINYTKNNRTPQTGKNKPFLAFRLFRRVPSLHVGPRFLHSFSEKQKTRRFRRACFVRIISA